jgi:hypothetical protein
MGQFEQYGLQPLGEIGLPKRGNRARLERYEKPKPKTKAAPSGASPSGPNKPPKNNSDKKEPANYKKKRPPEGGLGALVRK